MRCTHDNCRKRFTLKRHPTKYARAIKCPRCKRTLDGVGSAERSRLNELAKQDTCWCYLPFPHARGTVRGCIHYNGVIEDEPSNGYEDYFEDTADDRSLDP